MDVSLRFLGAAGTVTGSRHLLEIEGRRVLIDCGLFQGRRDIRTRNWDPFPIPPASIDAIVLTHGHLDHVGYLPRLARLGYAGPVYTTAAGAAITDLVLRDAAFLQEEEARHANRHNWSRHDPALPLFTAEDAEAALGLLVPVGYQAPTGLGGGVSFRYETAGHILGSAHVHVSLPGDRRVVFSGDIGQYDAPIIPDPTEPRRADYLVMECTYGGRSHGEADAAEQLAQTVNDTVRRAGVVVIPAFAIGRTQAVIYLLRELIAAGRIPDLPVYVDSPMAISAVEIYCRFAAEHDLETRELEDAGRCPIHTRQMHFTRTRDESKAINRVAGPAIIISASGMLVGGRILHHLINRLPEARNTLLFVGFQPEGSVGRRLLEGAKSITLHQRRLPVRARVTHINALSAHADQPDLLRWLGKLETPPRETILVHGEPPAAAALRQAIRERYGWQVHIARHLERRPLHFSPSK